MGCRIEGFALYFFLSFILYTLSKISYQPAKKTVCVLFTVVLSFASFESYGCFAAGSANTDRLFQRAENKWKDFAGKAPVRPVIDWLWYSGSMGAEIFRCN